MANDNDRVEIDKLEMLRADRMARAGQLQAERDEIQSSKLDHIALTIDTLEKKLRAEGSELAKVRDAFVAERGHLMIAVKQDEERLRELSSRTLPFALCPSVLRALEQAPRGDQRSDDAGGAEESVGGNDVGTEAVRLRRP